jgi:hypothetical protein
MILGSIRFPSLETSQFISHRTVSPDTVSDLGGSESNVFKRLSSVAVSRTDPFFLLHVFFVDRGTLLSGRAGASTVR